MVESGHELDTAERPEDADTEAIQADTGGIPELADRRGVHARKVKGVLFWRTLTAAVVVIALLGLLAAMLGTLKGNADLRAQLEESRHDTAAAHAETRSATANAEKLYQQLLAAGQTPEAAKPSTIVGVQGQPGLNGINGRDATPDQVAAAINAYCAAHNDCTPVPIPGEPGSNGTNGSNGTDGQTGQPGPAGATGAQGPQGLPGTNGTDGTDGQPPTGWTYTDALGFQHTCSRTDPFDAAAPTYTCN